MKRIASIFHRIIRTPPVFLIHAPPDTHRSSGVRALYRLCHHLNTCGYRTARVTGPGEPLPNWTTPIHAGPVGRSIVIYPEVVSGNPLKARKVVRWVLNNPGLLGGDATYPDDEMVFVYDRQRLPIVNRAVSAPLGPQRILWVGLVDPQHIYPNPRIPKTIDCSFTHKGHALRDRYPLPAANVQPLESLTPTLAALGDTLRRTRTLYSYDHYSNVLREAAICGCAVRVLDAAGNWHDPQLCACPNNIQWHPAFRETYATHFHDHAFVAGFIRELETRWSIPG